MDRPHTKSHLLWPVLAFVIPFAIHAIAFAVMDISPFGQRTRSMMVIDNFHQYSPFLIEFREILKSGGSLLYSWNSGLGSNYWARYAYYLASPLNVLFTFFPARYLPEFIVFISLFRTGFSGFAFYTYARGKFGKDNPAYVAFATMYAASAYMLAYYWNIMWFDCIALLPLIILGLERLARGRRGVLYCVTLAIAMYSNYYIALIICIFAFFYFITYSAAGADPSADDAGAATPDSTAPGNSASGNTNDRHSPYARNSLKSASFRRFCLQSSRFVFYSALAAGLAAIILIPTSYALSVSQSAGIKFPTKLDFYYSSLEILSGHLFNIAPSVMSGKPNLYCGLAALILIPLYFLNRKFSVREKAAYGILLVFMLLSCNINYLNYIWHGLHFPNSLPYRFTFLYIFIVAALALKAFVNLDGVRRGAIFGAFAAAAAFALVLEKLSPDIASPGVLYPSLIFLGLNAAVIAWAHTEQTKGHDTDGDLQDEIPEVDSDTHIHDVDSDAEISETNLPETDSKTAGQPNKRGAGVQAARRLGVPVATIAIVLLTTAEMSINAGFGINSAGSGLRNNYMEKYDSVKEAVTGAMGDDGFYRVEFLKDTVSNTPSLYGYRGASYFSSTAVLQVTDLMGSLGLRPSSAWYIYKGSTPIINSLFSLKYLLTWDDFYTNPLYPKAGEVNGISIYENPYALPLGFFAEREVLGLSVKQPNVFKIQNDFIKRSVDRPGGAGDVLRPVDIFHKESKNAEITSKTGNLYNFKVLNSAEPAYINFTLSPVPVAGSGESYLKFWDQDTIDLMNQSVRYENNNRLVNFSAGDSQQAGGDIRYEKNYRLVNFLADDSPHAGGDAIESQPTGSGYRPLYLYIQSRQIDYAWYIKGNSSEGHNIKYYPYIIDMQYYGDAGGDIEISLKIEESPSGNFEMYAYYLDEEAFAGAMEILQSRPMEIDTFSDTKIAGSITADRPGVLFTTIPYDRGWSVRLNGDKLKRDDIEFVGDGFLAVSIGAGTHRVEFTYMPEGFLVGLIVSLACAALLITLTLAGRKNPRLNI